MRVSHSRKFVSNISPNIRSYQIGASQNLAWPLIYVIMNHSHEGRAGFVLPQSEDHAASRQ